LRRETTVTLRWIVARLQAGSWKSLAAKLHRWRKTQDSPGNASRLLFDPRTLRQTRQRAACGDHPEPAAPVPGLASQ
jgi:GH24 family phage-related lysozyme (muramidase)